MQSLCEEKASKKSRGPGETYGFFLLRSNGGGVRSLGRATVAWDIANITEGARIKSCEAGK